jgi:hypothetical protein
MKNNKMVVGSLEECDLPDLGICSLHVRVDTGAKTSSLHVDNIDSFEKNGKSWVSFDLHPDIHDVDKVQRVNLPIKGQKVVKSSSADKEKRLVIKTLIRLGDKEWPIKLTLTDRSEMNYLMLLGREAMKDKIMVDPSEKYLLKQK